MDSFIPVNQPVIGNKEKEYVLECLNTNWISSEGPFVQKFEESFSRKVNRNYGIACSNGTAALDIALKALRLSPGAEVIMPSFTIISCANAILKAGYIPVLVDSESYTWNMDIKKIESSITPKTEAIMMVHIYGLPCDVDPILEISKKYNLAIVEDAAEIIGGDYKSKPCGSFGTISTFSFYPNKHVTTGEGGMVVTNNQSLSDRCKSLRNLCFKKEQRFIHDEIGWNYRMTNIQAALGLAQLERLDEVIKIKKNIGNKYLELLSNLKKVQLPLEKTSYAENVFWVFGLVLDDALGDNKRIMEKLNKRGIGTRPFFWPMNKQPVFNKMGYFKNKEFPVAENLSKQGFYLPSGIGITDAQIRYVTDQLISCISD